MYGFVVKLKINGEIEKEKDMRLIDADKLLYDDIDCEDGYTYMIVHAPEIDRQPTIEVSQWIPCSERLPEETGYYIVTVKSKNIHETKVRPILYDNYRFGTSMGREVIAWMPLPQAYVGKEE